MKKIILFSVILALIWWGLQTIWPFLSYTHWPYIFVYFLVVYLLGHLIVSRAKNKDTQQFWMVFFATMVGRLLLSIAFAGLAMYFNPDNRINFVIIFGSLYLLYLGFEIYTLLTNFRPDSKSS